jgi:outer membrane protein
MKGRILLVITAILSLNGLFAQENQAVFSLEEAREYAVLHNKTLINAGRDLDLAQQRVREAAGSGLPQVNASLDYMTNFNYEFALDFGGGTTEPPDIDYSLLDAGDYEVLDAISQMFSGPSGGSTIVMEDQANANLQVTQLIFSGQYWVGIQVAKLGRKIAEQSLTSTELDVKENVMNSYYLILVTEELLRIINENIDNLKEILEHTTNMFRVGMMEQTDVDQLKINLSQLENAKKAMERNVELNYNMFRLVTGIESGTRVILSDSLSTLLADMEEAAPMYTDFDPAVNPTYQLLMTQEEISAKMVDMQRWSHAPVISGYYNYREKLLTTSFDLSPKNAAGLSMSLPIIAGGTKRAQVSQAKIELDKVSRNRSLLGDQLMLQKNQLTFEMQSAWDNYKTQQENVEVAKRVFESIDNKYRQGVLSSLDLTQANTNYLQAENNYISSILTLLQAKLKLDKLYCRL